jgi:hypothetical protein
LKKEGSYVDGKGWYMYWKKDGIFAGKERFISWKRKAYSFNIYFILCERGDEDANQENTWVLDKATDRQAEEGDR